MGDILLLTVMVGVVYWMMHEYGRYVRSSSEREDQLPYTPQRLRRRMTTSIILLMILGILLFREQAELLFDSPWWMLLYYSTALVGAMTLFLLMVADLLETTRQLRQAHREMSQHTAEDLTRELERHLDADKEDQKQVDDSK
jgi:CHASE3 domain sensor protein